MGSDGAGSAIDWWRVLELLIPTAVSVVLAWTLFRAERRAEAKTQRALEAQREAERWDERRDRLFDELLAAAIEARNNRSAQNEYVVHLVFKCNELAHHLSHKESGRGVLLASYSEVFTVAVTLDGATITPHTLDSWPHVAEVIKLLLADLSTLRFRDIPNDKARTIAFQRMAEWRMRLSRKTGKSAESSADDSEERSSSNSAP